jgi:dienelactone hydrolase
MRSALLVLLPVLLPWPLALACAAPRAPAEPVLLEHGPHPVGFEQRWAFDARRAYRTAFDDGASYDAESRPILVSLWYPAARSAGALMPRADYLPVDGDARTAALAKALARHERDALARGLFGAPEAVLAPAPRAAFAAYLARPTACVRGAPPAVGPFPLVLHHGGAGSSTGDDAELCEHLASRGFVVASAPFQLADGASLDVDGGEASAADLEFLVEWARARPSVARGRVGAVGHSAGAQALLRLAARPAVTPAAADIDALVLLDTTQDPNSLLDPRWSFVEPVLAARAEVREALLFAADPHAFFALGDELVGAERAYLTLAGLEHEDYVAQGIARVRERARLAPSPVNRAHAWRLASAYRALSAAVVAFLEAELTDDPVARAALARLERNPLAGAAPRLERMPRGARAPPLWDESVGRAPAPRQLRPVLAERGAPAMRALLERYLAHDGSNPVYTEPWFAYALLFELVQRERPDDARELYAFFRTVHPELMALASAQIAAFTRIGYRDYARAALATGQALDPARPEWPGLARALEPMR